SPASWSGHSAIGAKPFTAQSSLQMKAARTESRLWYWPASATMNLHRFGPSARIPTRWQDPFLAGLRRATAPVAAPVEYGVSQPVADHFTIRGRFLKLACY